MTLTQALHGAQQSGLDRLDAQLLLLQALGRPDAGRAWLLAHDQETLAAAQAAAFEAACARRLSGEPVAYITGHKGFFGLELQVDSRVLVPRPDTETLVNWALRLLALAEPSPAGPAVASNWPAPGSTEPEAASPNLAAGQARRLRVLDLGTGSGAVALALAHSRANLDLTATDASDAALAVARANADRLGLAVSFVQGNWLAPLVGQVFDLIVSNPPYIAAADPHLDALQHEPSSALASGPDGLDDIRHIIDQAPAHLKNGAWLLLEHGWDQAAPVRQLLQAAGFVGVASERDLGGHERCSGGQFLG